MEKEKKQIDKQNVAELKNVFTSDIISKLSPDAKAVVESILNSKEDIKDQVDTLLTDHIDEILTVLQKQRSLPSCAVWPMLSPHVSGPLYEL